MACQEFVEFAEMSKAFLTDALSVVANRELKSMFMPALTFELSTEKPGWGRSPVVKQHQWNGAAAADLSRQRVDFTFPWYLSLSMKVFPGKFKPPTDWVSGLNKWRKQVGH